MIAASLVALLFGSAAADPLAAYGSGRAPGLERDRVTSEHPADPLREAWSEPLPEEQEERDGGEGSPATGAAPATVGSWLGPWHPVPSRQPEVARREALDRSAPRGPPQQAS